MAATVRLTTRPLGFLARGLRMAIRLGPGERVATLVIAMLVAAAAIFTALGPDLGSLEIPGHIPWLVLALSFFVAEIATVHLVFRGEAHTITLGELPLVLGLFFASPRDLLLAAALGFAASRVIRRQRPMKLTFNLALLLLEVALAVAVFRSLVDLAPALSGSTLGAAFPAVLATTTAGMLLVFAAITLVEGLPPRREVAQALAFGSLATLANTSFALLGVAIVWIDPGLAWLLFIPAAVLIVAYRAYGRERTERKNLRFLYDTMSVMRNAKEAETAFEGLLRQARDMFRADLAEMLLLAPGREDRAFRSLVSEDGEVKLMDVVDREAVPNGPLHLRACNGSGQRLQRGRNGIRDAMVVPLRGDSGLLGTLLVANRRGDVEAFSASDLDLFETLADHASLALERNRLEQSLAELTRLQEELQQAHKLEALGQLAGGVAHEFNNMLMAINASTDVLLGSIDPADPAREPVTTIRKASDRAGAVTRELLAFGRLQTARPTRLNLNGVVTGIEPVLRPLIGEQIDLVLRLQSRLGRVRADRNQVEQVLVNLAVNARDAMEQGGRLTVSTENVQVADDGDGRGLAAGSWVALVVEDTGAGMDEETRARAFDPFFTTKEPGRGTGLGLASVYGIVGQSGGHVRLETEPDRGTRVEVYLPRSARPAR